MKKIYWIYNRIKSMSIIEVLYRFKKIFTKIVNKKIYKKNIEIKNLRPIFININQVNQKLDLIFGNLDECKNFNFQKFYYSFGNNIDILDNIDWHKGIVGTWEKNKYSLDIDPKYSDNIGDIRYTWEINRHHFFVAIALKYKKSGDEKYYNILKEHFYDWNKKNRFLNGVNWLSPMEIAIRSYQWLITYYILKDNAENEFKEDIINSIIASIDYVSKNLSKFSSANNHLILECVIMSIIGYCVEDQYKQDWFERGYNILEKELKLQIHDDGINKEQALHYQAFVTDALLQYNFIIKKIGRKAIHEDLIKKSLEFMAGLKVDKLNFDYGDSDDAKIINFSTAKINYYKYLLELGSVYYRIKFIKFDEISAEVKFISSIYNIDNLNEFKYKKSELYHKGGYLRINDNNNLLLMDIGELGYGSIAAHGHADALSLIYYYDNNPIIIDSGTYIYNIKSNLRDYFRSTEAHSTLSYNNKNQSQIKGPFLWGSKAKVDILYYSNKNNIIKLKAKHNGYKPFMHTREIEYSINEKKLIIKDFFDDKGKLNFILDNECKINRISSEIIEVISNTTKVYFKSSNKIDIEEIIISKAFMQKNKSKKLVIYNDFKKQEFIETIITSKL